MESTKEKKGWSNKEWDSTAFMVLLLLAYGGYLAACVFVKEFRDSEISKHFMLIFSSAIGGMVGYFFSKRNQEQNGKGGNGL